MMGMIGKLEVRSLKSEGTHVKLELKANKNLGFAVHSDLLLEVILI